MSYVRTHFNLYQMALCSLNEEETETGEGDGLPATQMRRETHTGPAGLPAPVLRGALAEPVSRWELVGAAAPGGQSVDSLHVEHLHI